MGEPLKILICAGTRPELIKLAPVYHDLGQRAGLKPVLCLTGQHDSLVKDLPRALGLHPDILLEPDPALTGQVGLLKNILRQLTQVMQELCPSMVIVQGDTASALGGAMAAAMMKIPVAHIEAGLRTHDLLSPFPEELYRQLISRLGDWHFCPTQDNRAFLLQENIPGHRIHITGNTSVDAVLDMQRRSPPPLETKSRRRPYVLMTLHRREVQGQTLVRIIRSFRTFAFAHPNFDFRVTLHPNPAIKDLLLHHLAGQSNILLLSPLDYPDFVPLMKNAFAILSDSGGIQEEAPALNVPVIVLREKTERQEAVKSGCLRLAGHDPEKIFSELSLLIRDRDHYIEMCRARAPFGDGRAGQRIGAKIEKILTGQHNRYEYPGLSSGKQADFNPQRA